MLLLPYSWYINFRDIFNDVFAVALSANRLVSCDLWIVDRPVTILDVPFGIFSFTFFCDIPRHGSPAMIRRCDFLVLLFVTNPTNTLNCKLTKRLLNLPSIISMLYPSLNREFWYSFSRPFPLFLGGDKFPIFLIPIILYSYNFNFLLPFPQLWVA